MSEYDQLCRILNERFLASPKDRMIEKKDSSLKPQNVKIDDSGKNGLSWTLYKFELDEEDFLPFFNKTNDAPEGLRKFCDYVLLVSCKEKTYVMLIELKRGELGSADKQLNASETFVEYLYTSAERLHKDFNDSVFNRRNIKLLKIKVKERKSKKMRTKGGIPPVNTRQEFISFESLGLFPIARFIKGL
jgi:hypothetical protein